MASGEYGSNVDSELTSLGINTQSEVQTFRALPRYSGNMATVLSNLNTAKSKCWVSRKRVRHDALRLLNEGAL